MKKLIRAMMDLIASEVFGKTIDKTQYAFTDDALLQMYKLAKSHDLAHLVGDALIKNGLIANEEIKAKFQQQILLAVCRYEQLQYELIRLEATLNEAEIPFIPLKGPVIRRYYPEPWMRTSCDIDVLVKEADLKRAIACLTDGLQYRYEAQNRHDVSLFTQQGQHIELHYTLLEDGLVNSALVVLDTVWDTAIRRDGYTYWCEMPDEMFYFYHIAHMAKHFVATGGCGIRPFLDMWVLNHCVCFDREKREQLLSAGGLAVFAGQAERLSEVWFGHEQPTEVIRQMEEFVLRGGVYGTNQNRIAVQQQKQGGRFRYALSKIFIPYNVIKFHYPILQKHRFLTPVMEVRRWGKLIFCGHLKRTAKELQYNNHLPDTEVEKAQTLLKNVGL